MKLKITILIDNHVSWIVPYAVNLKNEIIKLGHTCGITHKHKEVTSGDILILLSCTKVFEHLDLNECNLVVHESELPNGRGMSPFTWQILEGVSRIPVTLLEASKELDSGVIYDQVWVHLKGTELVDDWRQLQAEATMRLVLRFVQRYPNVQGREQKGAPSFYRARKEKDSRLDISKSIDEQFNLLRVVDNKRYPAWFEKNGVRYKVEVSRLDEEA